MRALVVLPLLAFATVVVACATPPVRQAVQRCGDDGAPPVLCDGEGRLVACAGDEPVVAQDGIGACLRLEGVGFLATCKDAPSARGGGGPSPADLIPCSACDRVVEPIEMVTLASTSCTLGELPPDAYADDPATDLRALDEEPVVRGALYESCPCEEGLVCDREFQVCVEPAPCDPFAPTPCPPDEECTIGVEDAVCLPTALEDAAVQQ